MLQTIRKEYLDCEANAQFLSSMTLSHQRPLRMVDNEIRVYGDDKLALASIETAVALRLRSTFVSACDEAPERLKSFLGSPMEQFMMVRGLMAAALGETETKANELDLTLYTTGDFGQEIRASKEFKSTRFDNVALVFLPGYESLCQSFLLPRVPGLGPRLNYYCEAARTDGDALVANPQYDFTFERNVVGIINH